MITTVFAKGERIALTMVAGALLPLDCYGPTNSVPPDPVYSIEVSPAADTLRSAGATRRFSAVPRDIDYETVPGVTFRWSSQDTSVATVDATGLARAKGSGVTTITATAGGIVGTAAVTVVLSN
jgi:uncharacterized protein YjdB